MALLDPHGRKINYLRLSVTDRCNLRCRYCMPAEGVPKRSRGDILCYEDLHRVAQAAIALGMEKIRVTGGEPLVRKGIVGFLEKLADLPGLKRLVLTTNGVLLKEMAADIRAAGVESINISLDSLRPDTFFRITRGGDLRQVLDGIEAAERAGFPYLKINVVVMRGVNEDEVADFAALTLDRPYRVRFIEYMPTLPGNDRQSLTVPGEELLLKLSERFRLQPAGREVLAGPAVYYRIAGAAGMVGVITPVSCHFCHECNRVRVTSTGVARSCLFSDRGVDLKPFLKGGDETVLQCALRRVIAAKPERHSLCGDSEKHAPLPMSLVGG
jgi:cyclic pyranopterin phosphate synthase